MQPKNMTTTATEECDNNATDFLQTKLTEKSGLIQPIQQQMQLHCIVL